MPTIRATHPFKGYYPKDAAEFILEANNNSEGERQYELIVRNDFLEKDKILLTLDMDEYEVNQLIQMLKTILLD